MNLFGRPCKQMIKYDGKSMDLEGVGLPLGGPLKFDLARLNIKSEILQTAGQITQLLDAAQLANCTQINMIQDDKERMKLVNQAIQSQEALVKFALVMKLVEANPSSPAIQNALATWIASQTPRIPTLSGQVEAVSARGAGGEQITAPSKEQIQSSIESAKTAEPQLAEAIQRGAASPDLTKILDESA